LPLHHTARTRIEPPSSNTFAGARRSGCRWSRPQMPGGTSGGHGATSVSEALTPPSSARR